MLTDIIGGVTKLGSSIFGGLAASRAMKNVKANVEGQLAKNEDWFNRRYNEDATQRADALRVLDTARKNILERNQQAAGAQAVAGGTEESLAATKAANNAALAEATSQIAMAGQRRKDNIEDQYLQRNAALNETLNNLETGRANQIIEAANQGMQAGKDILSLG